MEKSIRNPSMSTSKILSVKSDKISSNSIKVGALSKESMLCNSWTLRFKPEVLFQKPFKQRNV